MPDDIERVAGWIRAASAVTALTGAGISTESGIPDFRGPAGVWTRDPGAQRMVDIQVYLSDPEVRRRAWQRRRSHEAWTAEPNAGHRALAALEQAGKVRAVITQNIDRLHQKAGNQPSRVIELHGSMEHSVCLACGDRRAMAEALHRVAAGEADPPCRVCGGVLKSGTIFFGESLDPDVLRAAQFAASACELFLVVGTSLTVAPASWLPGLAAASGARVAIVNAEPTSYDDQADAVIRAPIGVALPQLADLATRVPD